ncbi:cellulose synthase subunit BcsC-related outer membrane protein [Cupriavidus sp. AU9028]|uniref:cellulose synthase subunit BcsC-related outer membrane protein n=1 Tax=Cupriavidus sp. AU9028 TaxID=2871157 RepID=UPI001C97BAE0|nr:cellulose synthase subunit BcsC-related outer membrane protein [Cupriavidus sp. AU9028]MBY4896297.1 BCSC C-terminal domain-containing protein [Cupriavidus sp. AU9028]
MPGKPLTPRAGLAPAVGLLLAGSLNSGVAQAQSVAAPGPAQPGRTAGSAATASAPPSPQMSQLLSSARMWEAKNRQDMARTQLDKILTLQPDQPDALLLLAQIELRSNRPAEAEKLLQRLRRAHPGHAATRELEDAYRLATRDKRELAEIRLLSRAGKSDEAVARLRQLFPHGAPSGDMASDYYRMLSDTAQGRAQAIAELRARTRRDPSDLRLAMALASLLTDRSATRQEGLEILRDIARRPDGDRQGALDLWRRTLYSVSTDPDYYVWFERYLREAPDDQVARDTMADLAKVVEARRRLLADPDYQAQQRGLRALERGRLDEAEAALQQALRSRDSDAEAVGGLGLVRLRQGRHDEARELFARALKLDPEGRNRWSSLLDTAAFWGSIAAARRANEQGKPDEAERLAREALRRQPDNGDAQRILADALIARGQRAQAEALLRKRQALQPPDIDAVRTLAQLLRDSGRSGEIEALLADTEARLARAPSPSSTRDEDVRTLRVLRADLLSLQADQLLSQRLLSPALARLEEAVRLAPDAAWTRYSLARVYRDLGLPAMGRTVMEEGLHRAPAAEMRYAAALYLNAIDDPDSAAAVLAQIPGAEQTEGMRQLAGNLRAQQRVREARLALAAGHRQQARALLDEAARDAMDDPQMLATVGREWIALGEPARGLRLVDDWLATHPDDPAIGVRLRYGELLAAADRDEALRDWLADIGEHGTLTPEQRETLNDQTLRLALRDSDRLIARDDFAGAARVLAAVPAPLREDRRWGLAQAELREAQGDDAGAAEAARALLAREPRNADARLLLARLDERAGRDDEALAKVREVLGDTPADDINTRLSAARRLTSLQQADEAQQVVTQLQQQYPGRSDLTLQQGRIAQSRGQFEHAAALYRRALDEERREGVVAAPVDVAQAGTAEPQVLSPGSVGFGPAGSSMGSGASGTTGWFGNTGMADPSGPSRDAAQADDIAMQGTPAQRALLDLESRRQGQVATAFLYSNKSGDSGVSRLGSTEIPLLVRIPHRYTGHVFFHADTVRLDAGTLANDSEDAGEFGQIAGRPGQPWSSRGQQDTGMALAAGYAFDGATESWRADVGTTPLGFTEQNLVGGFRYRAQLRRASATVDVSRRPVTSSLISYAGAVDPASGEQWGGVLRNGVRVGYSHDVGRGSVFATVGAGLLTGHNVMRNREVTVRAGMDWPLLSRRDQRVITGLVLNYWRYSENLRYYTFGHGGYYSPQRYLSVSVPVQWSGRRGGWSWRLEGSAGLSNTDEKAMDLYPTRPDLQAAAGGAAARYTGGSGGGFSYTAAAAVEYRLTPQWIAGLVLQIDRSRDYAPNRAFAYLRYFFDRQRGPVSFPPDPVQPYSSY